MTFLFITVSCKKQDKKEAEEIKVSLETPFDSTLVKTFFVNHPKLQKYQADVEKLYRKHQFHYVWYDDNGINDFGNLLYDKINNLEEEGVQVDVPYKNKLADIYEDPDNDQKPDIDTELLSSSLYFFYADKVYHGIPANKTTDLGWYLPRKKQSYVSYLDSLLIEPNLINKDEKGCIKPILSS